MYVPVVLLVLLYVTMLFTTTISRTSSEKGLVYSPNFLVYIMVFPGSLFSSIKSIGSSVPFSKTMVGAATISSTSFACTGICIIKIKAKIIHRAIVFANFMPIATFRVKVEILFQFCYLSAQKLFLNYISKFQ